MLTSYRVYCYNQLESPAVAAGENAVLIGAQNGLFPDVGCAVPGEMGGLWAGEIKVCDGFFLAVDDVPLRTCDAYEAHPVAPAFHYRMQKEELHVVRRQFIPDDARGCVIELTIENLRDVPRLAEVSFTVRTDMLTVAAARGENGLELGRDVGEYDDATQAFYARDSRNPWYAVWGADSASRVLAADLPQTVYGFGNTQGKGINGRLFYRMRLKPQGQATMRLFVAGGYPSRSRAEDALADLRARAERLYSEKEARVAALIARSEAELPDEILSHCWNWAKIYDEWLTRRLPRGGRALCADLPEHPDLYGEDWTEAVCGLLPLGGVERAKEMLRTLCRLRDAAQIAPGRVARGVSLSGQVTQVGGPKESAQFVALVAQTLLWSGDAAFAREMLPETGLCVSYLRRATRGFADVPENLLTRVREALEGQAAILRLAGEDDAACLAECAKIPKPEEPEALPPDAPYADAALWHGARDHVEQMVGCLSAMAQTGLPGLPGALRRRDAGPGVLLQAQVAAGFVRPLTQYLFGLMPHAAEKTLVWHPHTPIGWDGWALRRLSIGEAEFDVRSERVSPSRARYTIKTDAAGWTAVVTQRGETRRLPIDGELTLIMED